MESLLHTGLGQSQIDARVAGAKELAAVLRGDAYIPAGMLHFFDGIAVGRAPVGAVNEEHSERKRHRPERRWHSADAR